MNCNSILVSVGKIKKVFGGNFIMAKVNDEAKMRLLNEAFGAENYLATAYAVTNPGYNVFSMFGLLGVLVGEMVDKTGFKTRHNAYVGVTTTGVNVVILDGLNNNKIKYAEKFNFTELEKVVALDKKTFASLHMEKGGKKYTLQMAKKILGAKLATQKEDASAVVAKVNELTSATNVA